MDRDELVHRVKVWVARDPHQGTQQELLGLLAAEGFDELEHQFAGRLKFGTAGLRGILGAGPMRMNRLVVRETTAGLGAYLQMQGQAVDVATRGVVIGYDGRHGSTEFASDAAAVLVAMDIPVMTFADVVPTPMVAFAVKDLNAAAGVMVTASHNPPAYNGYKVYWGNGAQIVPPHDKGIADAIDQAAQQDIPFCDISGARSKAKVVMIGPELEQRYLQGVAALSVRQRDPGRSDLGIAYTPLHGVGADLAEKALRQAGFSTVRTVGAQREPDGDFPTVAFPNPEEKGAMDLVLELARDMDAELAVANDPDADRLAVAVREGRGQYRMLTGDQIGVLLGAERLTQGAAEGVLGNSIVSSRMLGAVATAAGATHYESLTGFKWIANVGMEYEARGKRVLFGYEEALGYTVGDLVRDKDGISGLVAFCELAAWCKEQGRGVLDRLEDLYREHGLYLTRQQSLALDPDRPGPPMGDLLRDKPPTAIGGQAVTRWIDIASGTMHHADGRSEPFDMPASDVLMYFLADDSRVIVRPSGTEPKLKCYYEVIERLGASEKLEVGMARAEGRLQALLDAHQADLATLG